MRPALASPAVAAPCAKLALLGGFRLDVADHVQPVPSCGQRLLALLALHGGATRDRAAGALWPDTDQARALANLRTVIWRCKPVVDAQVLVCVGAALDLHPRVQVDVRVVFDQGVRALNGHGPPPDLALLQPRAELLPDWDEDWLLQERERLRQLRMHLLETWADHLAEAGSFALALDVALTVLSADVLRESAHRAVIKVHRAEGNVREARRAYDTCRRVLRTQIGVDPSPQTAALVP